MVSDKDRAILRELAQQMREQAETPRMDELKKLWLANNCCRGARPMVTIETWTFGDDIVLPRRRCEGEYARGLENYMLQKLASARDFKDDTIIEPYYPVRPCWDFKPLGLDVRVEKFKPDDVGHHFIEQINDLEADFGLLKESSFSARPDETREAAGQINEIFGDILPARVTGSGLYVVLTQNLVHLMSMTTLLMSMYDYPELFLRMMQMLTDDYLRFFRFLEAGDHLLPTTGSDGVGQGTYAYNDELPTVAGGLKTRDLWGFCDSQETLGVSPAMFGEFIFPFYQRIANEYGLLSYGCCEPVHTFWEDYLSKLTKLRKISISPWCDERFMGERLAGKKIVYHRKPSPNFLGLGGALDEDAVTAHIRTTVESVKGCALEITQRDVYTVGGDLGKVARYVEIIRRETENCYR
ncbi:MAG: hypothetical protein LBK60_02645 [Verrucomicrobiales bacterium]|jgi:hypothetical protein|nr:hypothetical protein [Verrucomicrobiales bacterium]